MFDRFLNRGRVVGIQSDPAPVNPLTIRLRHIDAELARFAQQQPRTPHVLAAIDALLDRRLGLRPGTGGAR